MKNIRGFFAIIKRIEYILNNRQKQQAIWLFLLLFCSSFFELLGVSAIVPFIQAILMPQQLLDNQYIKMIWDSFQLKDYVSLIIITGSSLIFLYIFKNLFIIFASYIRLKCTMQWQKDISLRMLRSYMVRPYVFFLNTNSAEIYRGCSSDVDNLNATVNQLFVLITECVTVFVIGIYLLYTDFFTAVCTFILISFIFAGIMVVLKPRVKRAGISYNRSTIAVNKSITQISQGIKDILVMQRKEHFVQDYEKTTERLRESNLTYNIVSMLPDRVTEGLCVSGVIGIVLIRLIMGDDSMVSFIPKLAAFAMASIKILPSVGKISNCLNTIVFARPGVDRLYDNIHEAEKVEKKRGIYIDMGDVISEEDEKWMDNVLKSQFEVKMSHVTWRYNADQPPVLNDMSLSIKKGESIGFIGTSGGGKTTTVDVLLGLFHPEKGTVTINNRVIYDMPYIWGQIVAYVPQNVFLLDDTVRENIQFGLKDVSEERIWECLEKAQLRSFIESLPNQLNTVVGERGIRFSGGQRQRIAIARALLCNPQILVMDEATAALDNETENAVIEAVEALQGTITMIIVAHRLTTIRNCDRVYEIRDGVAIETRV